MNRSRIRNRPSLLFQCTVTLAAVLVSSQGARADLVTFTGNLTSDASAVSSTDPVLADPATINTGDPFSLALTYDPSHFTHTGSSYVLTSASALLKFDGYSFDYTSAAGNYIAFSTPGVFGTGTASFLICSSLADCSTTDFITLYFKGTIASLSTLAAQASGLAGDPTASPSEFEFLRNFTDGSQTDLQGTLGSVTGTGGGGTTTPEASGLALLAFGIGAAVLALRPQEKSS